jgi:hypothetical protein
VIRFDKAIHDLGQFLTLHAELAWASRLTDCQDYVRAVLPLGSNGGKDTVVAFGDVLNLFAGTAFEVRALHDLEPELHEIFFGQFGLFEFAIHGKFNRPGHNEFPAGIFGDGTPISDSSTVMQWSFFSMARSEAVSPAGLAPTIRMS